MLLILSNMLKAFWTFTSPIIILTNGPLQSSSAFCQASGFFLAGAIEASGKWFLPLESRSCLDVGSKRNRCGSLDDCYPYRPLHFETPQITWKSRPLPIPLLRVRYLGILSSRHGKSRVHQPQGSLHLSSELLLSTYTTLLVPHSSELGSTLFDLLYDNYRLRHCLRVRQTAVQRLQRRLQASTSRK